MSQPRERPKVGIGVFVISEDHPNCVLVGKRKGSTGSGKYALPGGHLEFGEGWEECGFRETLEETGLNLKCMNYVAVVNAVVEEENYHYVTIFVKGAVDKNFQWEPDNLEPDKCEGWQWIDWDHFVDKDSCFCPLRVFIENGYNPFSMSKPT